MKTFKDITRQVSGLKPIITEAKFNSKKELSDVAKVDKLLENAYKSMNKLQYGKSLYMRKVNDGIVEARRALDTYVNDVRRGVVESTQEYAKSLDKIANDRKLKAISNKDKQTLSKIADMLAKANEDFATEALSPADKKKRLSLIRKAVEKISKSNAEKAKKDALRMMKDSGMFDESAKGITEKNYKLGPDTVDVTFKGMGVSAVMDKEDKAKLSKIEKLAAKNNLDVKWIKQNPEWLPRFIGDKQDFISVVQTYFKGTPAAKAIGAVKDFDKYFKGGYKSLFKLNPQPKK